MEFPTFETCAKMDHMATLCLDKGVLGFRRGVYQRFYQESGTNSNCKRPYTTDEEGLMLK